MKYKSCDKLLLSAIIKNSNVILIGIVIKILDFAKNVANQI